MIGTNSITATVGAGRSIHFAYYVGENLTGTYCDRAAWESKRVRPMHSLTADAVTCTRCLKVAASPDSVPNTVYELAPVGAFCRHTPELDHTGCPSSVECVVSEPVELEAPVELATFSHDAERCSVVGCAL